MCTHMLWLLSMSIGSSTRRPPPLRLSHVPEINMTHSYVRQDSFYWGWPRPTWLIHMCDMTHSYVWHDSFICVTWLIHMWYMTHESNPRWSARQKTICAATHCSTLQHALQDHDGLPLSAATHCNTLQHTLQHTLEGLDDLHIRRQFALQMHCNKLQHTATHTAVYTRRRRWSARETRVHAATHCHKTCNTLCDTHQKATMVCTSDASSRSNTLQQTLQHTLQHTLDG